MTVKIQFPSSQNLLHNCYGSTTKNDVNSIATISDCHFVEFDPFKTVLGDQMFLAFSYYSYKTIRIRLLKIIWINHVSGNINQLNIRPDGSWFGNREPFHSFSIGDEPLRRPMPSRCVVDMCIGKVIKLELLHCRLICFRK